MGEKTDISVYERMLDRERKARREAERLLEEKSLALYEANQGLEEALAQQRREAFYQRVILESVTDGILTVGSDGRVQTANPSTCKIFGYKRDQLIGRDVSELLTLVEATERPSLNNHFLTDHCTAKQPVVAAIGRSADGGQLALELSASYGEFDDDVLITWVLRDVGFVNALKRQSDLSQRLEGIGELAAGIAHEINTPIQFVFENTKFFGEAYQAVDNVLRFYEQHTMNNKEVQDAAQAVCSADQLAFYRSEVPTAIKETKAGAWRIGEIVAAIKEFAHPGTGDCSLTNLNDLVATAITMTANNCKYVATVECDLDEELPKVSCLRGQITQVIVNLIVNAADAISDAKNKSSEAIAKITIQTGADHETVFISVADTGIGIDSESREKIFLPFFTTKDVGKGTGQGLAITHSIVVENHNGSVDVESELGVGTKFIVRLPRQQATES